MGKFFKNPFMKNAVAQWRRVGLNFRYNFINQSEILYKMAIFNYFNINSNCIFLKRPFIVNFLNASIHATCIAAFCIYGSDVTYKLHFHLKLKITSSVVPSATFPTKIFWVGFFGPLLSDLST